MEDTEKMNKQLKQENEMLKQRNAELLKRISFLETELSKVNSWKKGKISPKSLGFDLILAKPDRNNNKKSF